MLGFLALPLCTAALAGCTDLVGTEPPMHVPAATSAHTVAVLECTADVATLAVVCRSPSMPRSGESRSILGNGQAKMASANTAFDSVTRIFRTNATVQNLLTEPIGTPDGTTVSGVKVFFSSGPVATSYSYGDTGTVRVENADGYGNFTAGHQPYFQYSQMLSSNQISTAKQWQWYLGPSVKTFSFQVKVIAATPSEIPLPATPPNGFIIPADSVAKLYAETNSSLNSTLMPGRHPRNILMVSFRESSTLEERGAALETVGASLIGGSGPFYYVQVPSDSTGAALVGVISRLSALPQVLSAYVDVTSDIAPAYSRAYDGSGWHTVDWTVDPAQAAGANWAAEAVSAPLAWGCGTGDPGTHVAVVDLLARNGDPHYNWVASIIRSARNDSVGIAGLMPGGTTAVSNAGAQGITLLSDLDAAIPTSDVINLSWSQAYPNALGAPALPSGVDSLKAINLAAVVRQHIQNAEAQTTRRPLYVIAAGNYRMDAAVAGIPRLATDVDLGSRVIVVTGTTVGGTLWTDTDPVERGSDTGGLVSLAAPGGGVRVEQLNHTVVTVSGTSFAAPHVAAAAGLLKSFDPRLSSGEIKSLLISGAANGQRTAGGYPILDVYESLKLAAGRKGAPVCGNAVWTDGHGVYVQRDSAIVQGNAVNQVDTIYSDTTSVRSRGVDVMHGGKHIRVNLAPGYRDYRLDLVYGANGWAHPNPAVSETFQAVDSSGGSYLASLSNPLSHDRDTVVTNIWDAFDGIFKASVVPVTSASYSSPYNVTITRPIAPAGPARTFCRVTGMDMDTVKACSPTPLVGSLYESSGWNVAYSPWGGNVVVGFSRYRSEWSVGAWNPCTVNATAMLCREVKQVSSYPASELVVQKVSNNTAVKSISMPNMGVHYVHVDESGDLALVEYETGADLKTYPEGGGAAVLSSTRTCGVALWNLKTGLRLRTLTSGDVCGSVEGYTFAPNRLRPTRGAAGPAAGGGGLFARAGAVPAALRQRSGFALVR